jgi:GNAT superfamily N-acetyltransferase
MDPYDWTEILGASQAEGCNMVHRLLTEFHTGANRFDAPGQALFVHLHGSAVVGVAGLNVEPETCFGPAGRIRRLYIVPGCRHRGLASSLIQEIASLAAGLYEVLTVNVGGLSARGFYERLGFVPVDHPRITHTRKVAQSDRVEVGRSGRMTARPSAAGSAFRVGAET